MTAPAAPPPSPDLNPSAEAPSADAPPPTGASRADPRRMLNRRFAAAMTVAAALAVANQALVQPALLALATDAPVINVAGRQRMLSQRLAKAALAERIAATPDERAAHREELAATLALWTRSHRGLRSGDAALNLPGENPPEIAAAFDALEPHFVAARDAARELIAGRGDPAVHRRTMLAAERAFLPRMDRIVNLYDAHSRRRVAGLRRTGWALTGLLLVALAAVGLFVLRPAGRTIAGQVAALRDARDRLEERVADRTRDLEHANAALHREHRDRLQAEEKQRNLLREYARVGRAQSIGQTASGLAHELNQPLGAVVNYIEGCLLRLEPGPAGNADRGDANAGAGREVTAALRKARDAALRAGTIVARIRRRAARGPVEFAPLDPAALAGEVAEFMREEARRRGVRLECRIEPPTARNVNLITGDRVQLQQVLTNFLTNAFEAVEAAGSPDPQVILGVCAPGPGRVELFVEDNGDGLAPHEADRVFDAFYSGRARGTGIGLAIARSIAEAHGGELSVRSVPGAGARFGLSLPGSHNPPA